MTPLRRRRMPGPARRRKAASGAARAARLPALDSPERFRLLVESVRDYAIFMLDPRGRVATWNSGARRLKGWERREIVGRHFSAFYPPEDVAAGKPARELRDARRDGRVEDEGWRLRKDGSRFWANVVITALRDPRGRLLGFAKVTRDLTERRAAEQELRGANAALEKSNRELDEYAAFVSHDLQEPLRKMASFAELLELEFGDALGADGRKYVRYVVDGATRMRALISDVFEYSRIGRSEPPMEDVELGEVVATAVRDLGLAVQEAEAEVRVGPLPRVRGNRLRLGRLFQNLLSNAVKYRREGRAPRVEVSARRKGRDWIVSVKDNGIGFEPRYADMIMRPFKRLHTKERYPGSGIGLATAQKIAELHKGELRAESTPGRGATFRVRLPAEGA